MRSQIPPTIRDSASGHWPLVIGHWSLVIVNCSLFIVLILLLPLTLPGCERITPTPESPLPTPIPSPLRPTPTLTPTREAQPMIVTLGLWLPEELSPYSQRPGAATLAQQLDDFSDAYPDVQVEVTIKKARGRGGLLDFLRTARDAAPSILPDLIVLDAAELATAAGSGLIQPLDSLLSPTQLNDRFPFATELGMVEGQALGFVIGVDMQHLAYRPTVFESRPVSWTQIISPPVPFLFPAGGHDRQINDATLIQYMAAGGKLTDQDGRPWLDADVMVKVLSFYSTCVGTGTISPTVVLKIADPDQSWEQFLAGESDMAVVRARRYWLEADETIAAAPIPTRDGRPFSIARGWALAMVADDPARQALAQLLLDWLIASDHSAQWTQTAGYLPGTRGALRMWDVPSTDRAVLHSVMEAAVPPPRPEAINTAGRVMQEALEAVLRRRVSPEAAAAAAIESLGQ